MELNRNLLKNYFLEKKAVIAAYIFGSSVSGKGMKKDIDIAILLDEKFIEERIKIQTDIYCELEKTGTVLVLNEDLLFDK